LKNRRRDRIPKSDLIGIIEGVPGVDSVNLWFVSEENEYFKANPANASEPDKGIDAFGDIIIGKGEYALVRGGWKNRNDVLYYDTTDQSKPGSINIAFGKDTSKTLNMDIHRINVDNIKNG
jgi:dihydrofolate reductase